mgnify:CR=1 FL=1
MTNYEALGKYTEAREKLSTLTYERQELLRKLGALCVTISETT